MKQLAVLMLFALLLLSISASAQVRTPAIGPGSRNSTGPSGGGGGGAGGGGGPPPTCLGVLDLSTGCSQLVAFGGLF
jgi:hypothetical protein